MCNPALIVGFTGLLRTRYAVAALHILSYCCPLLLFVAGAAAGVTTAAARDMPFSMLMLPCSGLLCCCDNVFSHGARGHAEQKPQPSRASRLPPTEECGVGPLSHAPASYTDLCCLFGRTWSRV